jgi:hypothetical protein
MTPEDLDRAEDEVRIANEAKAILSNPLYEMAYTEIRDDLMRKWELTSFDQAEIRETIFLSIKLLEALKGSFQKTIESGILASVSLESLEKSKTKHFKE